MLVYKFAQKGVPLGTVSSVTVKGVLRTLQTITGGAIREVESSWAGKRDSPTCGVGKSLSLSSSSSSSTQPRKAEGSYLPLRVRTRPGLTGRCELNKKR